MSTPQRGRRRPIAASTGSSSSATPRRESKKRAFPLESSPRGASLLTPEPAQKRRTMRGDGGDGSGGCSSGVHVTVPPDTDQENNNVGGDSSTGAVNTPGTNTAHLLLQLRRDCLGQRQQEEEHDRQQQQQQQQQKQQQQHQSPKPAATITSAVAGVAGQAKANAERANIVGKKRGLAVQVVGSGTAGAESETKRVLKERPMNLANANLRRPVKMGRDESEGCTCKKSRCLKLYCQCFARQSMCGQSCRCEKCHNSASHDVERQVAVKELLCRNPSAFGAKLTTEIRATAGGATAASSVVHSTGCGCSKSACLKRYCECFSAGIACSGKCRCRGCQNGTATGWASTGPGPMSRSGTGDVPEIFAKRQRTSVTERHPQDRAGTEVEGCPVSPVASEPSTRPPLTCSPDF